MAEAQDAAVAESPVTRLIGFLHRHRNWLALVSFLIGLASFLLVQRGERTAQVLVVTLPLAWLLILAENWLGDLVQSRSRLKLPPGVLRYAVQSVHQQSFFFTLPFFFYTTTWRSGQAVFTGTLIAAALASVIDPIYYRHIAPRRGVYLTFHALAVFVATLTALPMLWQLTTLHSLQLAAAATALLAAPTLVRIIGAQRPRQWLLLVALTVALGGGAWLARPWIPPATLWVSHGVITQDVDTSAREPADALKIISADEARKGVCAWTPIRAPRGLHENIRHVWMQNGVTLDSIPLSISGGRAEGYRAWSCKRNMPTDPRGHWQVRAMTEGGQMIGELRFEVR
ncbi:MAG: DUF5924 family protein [Stenotrophobium sp.]